jgi:membrane protein YqaA with SNARE-associated domain
MLDVFAQSASKSPSRTVTATFLHLGAFGLFFVAIIDSSPLPTFGGPDILTAILAAQQRNPWYEYAAFATAGSVLGAYFTFRIARKAGEAYLHSKFKSRKMKSMLGLFNKWGTGALVASTAIPFPFPTSLFFASAGASNYRLGKFLTVVAVCRGARYTLIAFIADHYGRHFVRVLRHPTEYWGWLLAFAAIIAAVIAAGVLVNKQLAAAAAA